MSSSAGWKPAFTNDAALFGFREYRCLKEVHDASLIVDCGANVGYSTVYFLTRYPRAKVIAVDPDPDNYALLEANVAPYGARCRPIRSAVWSSILKPESPALDIAPGATAAGRARS